VTTPVGPLVSYGIERFIVGSARDPILKIFDFRWPKKYYYTEVLPFSKDPLGPTPKPLTWISSPERERCCHMSGRSCTLHALARTNFYRPNCNVYLPVISQTTSPIYSLSKPSNMSSVVYAGLAGELVRTSLIDRDADTQESSFMKSMSNKDRCGYGYQDALNSIVETSDGVALSDISKSQRLPLVYEQRGVLSGQFGRLDETLTYIPFEGQNSGMVHVYCKYKQFNIACDENATCAWCYPRVEIHPLQAHVVHLSVAHPLYIHWIAR
jgi:hypothetical protein